MNRKTKIAISTLASLTFILAAYHIGTRLPLNPDLTPGAQIDALNGVAIYFNGGVNQTHGRNLDRNGYNIGIQYQCVEFVKRYYLQRFNHIMPDAYGHAKTFFDPALPDGALNPKRALLQFHNGSATQPAVEDIIVFGPSIFNPYGHVAIVAAVTPHSITIAQQNPGPFAPSREELPLEQHGNGFSVQNQRVLGWLRMPNSMTTPK